MQRVKPGPVRQEKILSPEFVSSDVANNHVQPLFTDCTEERSCHTEGGTSADKIKGLSGQGQ